LFSAICCGVCGSKWAERLFLKRCYLLAERPFEQSVTLSPHDDEEQREVSSPTRPVAVQIQPQTHLVAVFAGVKRCEERKEEWTL